MSGNERPQEAGLGLSTAVDVLAGGELQILGLMPNASNYTFLVEVGGGEERTLAVYKPEAGETPLWDFPDGTLGLREVAAYEVARALGWPDVPPTVLRDGPHGPGSVQLFVDFDPDQHYFTLRDSRTADFRRISLFDAVINNADRKAGHCLLGADLRIWLIDHGVCFHVEPKLRTVIWDFAGQPFSEEETSALRGLSESLASGELGERLDGLLAEMELDALAARIASLISSRTFPVPGSGRHFPWPPV